MAWLRHRVHVSRQPICHSNHDNFRFFKTCVEAPVKRESTPRWIFTKIAVGCREKAFTDAGLNLESLEEGPVGVYVALSDVPLSGSSSSL
jgi:hypothetical protein